MTPELMTEYLEAAKRAGVQSIGLELGDGSKLSAVFQVDLPLPPAQPVAPGGWKTLGDATPSLDAPFEESDE